jgi:iron complex outermembrane receptor protein
VKRRYIEVVWSGKVLGQRFLTIGGEAVGGERRRPRTIASILTLALLVFAAAPGFAQSTAPAAQSSAAAKASPAAQPAPAASAAVMPQGVEEITVTAEKREQLFKDVPAAVTALSSSMLEARSITDLNDLQLEVPGLVYATSGIDQEIYIRGVGVDDVTGNLEAPIATYVDGVYQPRTTRINGLGSNDLEIERLEVEKGPQGTLFGRNATGGLINIILKKPTDDWEGAVKTGGGSYSSVIEEGDISGPLIKHVLDMRAGASFYRDSGWIENVDSGHTINDHLMGTGRFALGYHPLDNLSVDYNLLLDKMVGGITDLNGPTVELGNAARQRAGQAGFLLKANDIFLGNNPWKSVQIGPLKGDVEDLQNDLTAKWDFSDWGYLKSISGFQEHSLGKSSTLVSYPIDYQRHNSDDKAITEEINFGGNLHFPHELGLNWIVGGYYQHEEFSDRFGPYILYFRTIEGQAFGREKLDSLAPFGDGTLSLPFNLTLFGGVRYTYDKKNSAETVTLHFLPFGANFPPPTTCQNLKFYDQFHSLSPRVGLGWAPSENVNLYVKYSEGYNAGGHYYNGCNNGYDAENLDVIEGGVKTRLFDGRLEFDADGYYNDYKKFQYFKLFQVVSGVVNAPEAEMWGGEFHFQAVPIENVSIDGNFAIMHSQYDRFHDGDEANPQFGVENLSGHQMTQAPNATEFIGLGYEWHIPWQHVFGEAFANKINLGALKLRGEWFHTSTILFRPYLKVPGAFGQVNGGDFSNPYSIFNFFATLPTEDDKWTLHFYAKNFTNTKYFIFGTVGQASASGVGGVPPWFGGDLTYRF